MKNIECERCAYYGYDEENDLYFCSADMDEDDFCRLRSGRNDECPLYDPSDEYDIVKKQN